MTADHRLAPIAPGRRPILGHALPLLRDRLGFLQQLRAHGPIVRIALGPKSVTVVNAPELIHQMLTAQSGHFTKGLLFEKLKLFGKDALPVADGPRHLTRRRLMQPAFHRERVTGYVRTMRDTAASAIRAWREGDEVDLKTEMQLMAQNIVMTAAFSAAPAPDTARALLTSVDTLFKAALRRALVPLPLVDRLPTRYNRRLARAGSTLHQAAAGIITDHRIRPDDYDDVISMLLDARDETGAPLPDDEILSEVTGLLAAGSETAAVVMAWLFLELGRHPDLEARLHTEVDTVLAGQELTADHLPRLTFTRALVQETLRLYSPAWLVTRQATDAVRLGDFTLPAGTDVIWSPYTLHRDPSLYRDPLRFDPDRWLPDRPQPPKTAFIPFGAGKRQCLGDAFAWTEMTIITALIASRWRLRPAPGIRPVPVGAITVHPCTLRMTTEARQAGTAREAA
ncbi:cytochrome P450 [Streptomyces albus]|uniref:cytochrome P450 n=1 Tax=Streptomyces sp. NRRL F-5917 TaxID=1463873 RepID=UPI0004C0FCEF|nr:cytochrome P450 [Streptomyces sp. NRRL F-5917]